MRKPRSVYFQIGITLLAVYTLYTIGYWIYQIDQAYRYLNVTAHRWAATYVTVGRALIRSGEVAQLPEILDEAMRAREIDYYVLRRGEEMLAFGSIDGVDDPILFPQTTDDGIFEVDNGKHFIFNQNGIYFGIGYKRNPWIYIRNFYEVEKFQILTNILFVSLFGLALTFHSFRDFREILRRLRRRRVNRTDPALARSSETLTLLQGLKGYQANVDQLTRENILLRGQVLPALKKEIASGRVPPYDFGCTLVRTDINNFTSIFAGPGRAQFMEVVNEFFVGVTHIVSRYRGYVHEFVGDEVIFYFKDEDHENSPAIALGALREIERLANDVSKETERLGYPFRVKSSLSWGTLRFGPLVDGFSLAGQPLIETVRILAHVHEKSENVVLFEEALAERLSFLSINREMGVVMLKGLTRSRKLRVHEAFVPLSAHLRQGDEARFKYASYYRSDADICETLKFVTENLNKIPSRRLQSLVAHFRSFRVTEVSTEIRRGYIECLETLLAECLAEEWVSEDDVFLLSALAAAAAELFPVGGLSGRLREMLMRCLLVQDRRVVANTLDVFAALDPDAGEGVFKTLVDHEDNRIVANALIKEAKRNWTKALAKRVGALMRMPSPYYKASGLYAVGEIAAFLKATDEVSYQADAQLQALIEGSLALVRHPNRMVRRQVLNVFVKTGNAHRLRELLDDPGLESEIRGELRALLGDSTSSQKAS